MGLNIADIDPKMLDELLAKGFITQEQIDSLRKDSMGKNKSTEKEKKSATKGNFHNRQGFGHPNGNYRQTSSKQLPYGEALDLSPEVLPPMIATAPYNFIPLPKAVLVSQLQIYLDKKEELAAEKEDPVSAAFRTYMAEKANLNGHIELAIETITPVFIGGGENDKFFAPGGKPIIPGSSLRGMVKNLYKIVTCGSWKSEEDLKNTHLYYRCLMAPKSKMPFFAKLHEKYADYMTSMENGHVKKNAKPGFLFKQGNKWHIYSLLPNKLRSIPIWKYMYDFKLNDRDIKHSSVRWDGHTAYVQIGLLSTDKLKRSQEKLEKATTAERAGWGKQYYKYMSIDDIDTSKRYPIPDSVIESYQGDKNRCGVDLMKEVRKKNFKIKDKNGFIAPCFFFLDDAGNVKSFGHGQAYRIPYDNSIMEAVPQQVHYSKDKIDFASAVFGISRKDVSWASRVTFDDAVPLQKVETLKSAESRILMQPNPTAFQLYLKQNQKDQLVHWDHPAAEVRGYKFYWHNKPNHNWHATAKELELSRDNVFKGKAPLSRKIEPLAPGTKFEGSIHFHDLTKEELGALMLIFKLGKKNEDIVYKIGMGKSIGLGSIRIKATLFLEDGSRYKTLFDNDGWHESQQEEAPDEYIAAYEALVKAGTGSLTESYYEAVENLRLMLDYNNTKMAGWDKATAQMDGDTKDRYREDKRFEKRNILPEAAGVIDKVRNRKA